MTNGFHDHFCPKCGHGFICHKITHCTEPLETLCLDHKMECVEYTRQIAWPKKEEPKP